MTEYIHCRECGRLHLGEPDQPFPCNECDRRNALQLATCDRCTVDVDFDPEGRPNITHEAGCQTYDEFMARVTEIEAQVALAHQIDDIETSGDEPPDDGQ